MRTTTQLSVTLPNEMAEAVRSWVASGEYANEGEVIRDGLRILLARDAAMKRWLRTEAAAAYDGLEANPTWAITSTRSRQRPARRQSDRIHQGWRIKKVVYSARAEQQPWELQDYIAVKSGFLDIGESFISEIVDFCDSMGELLLLGTLREDLCPGLRIAGFRRRIVIAYVARAKRIEILGVFYGGQGCESRLSTDGN